MRCQFFSFEKLLRDEMNKTYQNTSHDIQHIDEERLATECYLEFASSIYGRKEELSATRNFFLLIYEHPANKCMSRQQCRRTLRPNESHIYFLRMKYTRYGKYDIGIVVKQCNAFQK